jgi:hypothetical protein
MVIIYDCVSFRKGKHESSISWTQVQEGGGRKAPLFGDGAKRQLVVLALVKTEDRV